MGEMIKSNLDFYKFMESLKDNVDVWITDPPYPFDNQNGTGRYSHVNGNDQMYSRFDWAEMQKMISLMYDKTSEGGCCYLFCNRDGLFDTKDILARTGWTFRNLLVWDKQAMGMGYHWRNQTEYILYASKGKTERYVKSHSNIFSFKKPGEKDSDLSIGYNVKGCISAKPYKIWSKIIQYGVLDGDIIADPFAGTDPMSAALNLDKSLLDKINKAYSNTYDI